MMDQAVEDVRYTTGEGGGSPIPMILCPFCAKQSHSTLMWYVSFFVVLAAGALIFAYLFQW